MFEKKVYAVAGRPILHSRSPFLFNSFFGELGLNATYTRLLAKNAEQAVMMVNAVGLDGANITSPFKKGVITFLDALKGPAMKVDAVNCVVREKGGLVGYNTDVTGAVQALRKNGIRLSGRKVVILGAGGAARAVAAGCMKAQAESVTLVNRSRERAKEAAEHLDCEYGDPEKLKGLIVQSDILISCLPSVSRLIEPSVLRKKLVVMDANYRDSWLLSRASEKGCRIISGLDWLFYQALPCFELFTHKKISRHLENKIRCMLTTAPRTEKSSIALIGFMGSGKTHVGRGLAEKTAVPFIDTDDVIEEQVGSSISEIFREKGEGFFRQVEKSVIRRILSDSGKRVISFGGGCVLDPENRDLIRKQCLSIWLWVTLETAMKRMDLCSRPLLNVPQAKEKAFSMLEQRKFLYAQTADLVIDAETGDINNLVQRIVDEMG